MKNNVSPDLGSGYGRRLIPEKLLVQILILDTRWTVFHNYLLGNCIDVWKDPKLLKRGRELAF